jgi:hypothetical protein
MNQSQDPLMDAAMKAARNAGACCPKAVAEILRDRLYSEQRGLTTSVYAHFQGETLTIDAAVAKMRETPRLGRLFSPDGKFDFGEMTQPEYRAIRRVQPELLGLR